MGRALGWISASAMTVCIHSIYDYIYISIKIRRSIVQNSRRVPRRKQLSRKAERIAACSRYQK